MSFAVSSHAQLQKTAHYGDTITATAQPNPGWKFDAWVKDGIVISTDPVLFYIVTGDADITAQFSRFTYEIKININPPNSGTVTGGGFYLPGDIATIKVNPNQGFELGTLDHNGLTISENPYSFLVEKDGIITASMIPKSTPLFLIFISLLILFLVQFLIKFKWKN